MADAEIPSLAILGGTFDPVHTGHCRLAIEVKQLGFDQVIMMPNNVPPHRDQPLASNQQRLDMLQLATQGFQDITISELELQSDTISYSVESLAKLRRQYPNHAISWIMGADAWQHFDQWHQWQQILKLANLLIINRPGAETGHSNDAVMQRLNAAIEKPLNCPNVDTLHNQMAGCITFAQLPALDISASDLRRAIARGDNIDLLTPLSVQTYIQQHALYR